jgi:ribosomal protein S11
MLNKLSIIRKGKFRVKFKDEQFKDLIFFKRFGYDVKKLILRHSKFDLDKIILIGEQRRYRYINSYINIVLLKLNKLIKEFTIKDEWKEQRDKFVIELWKQIVQKRELSKREIRTYIYDEIRLFYKTLPIIQKELFFDWSKKPFKYDKSVYVKYRKFKRLERRIYIKKGKIKKIFKLILKHSNNNFFIILTTIFGKVLWYSTAGQFCEFYNIKRKRSHYLVDEMLKILFRRLKILKVKNVKVFIRSSITKQMRKVLIFLKGIRVRVDLIKFDKRFPHHFGRRRKKLRRI